MRGPCEDQALNPPGQPPPDDGERRDADQGLVLAVDGMDMRWAMLAARYIEMMIPLNAATLGTASSLSSLRGGLA